MKKWLTITVVMLLLATSVVAWAVPSLGENPDGLTPEQLAAMAREAGDETPCGDDEVEPVLTVEMIQAAIRSSMEQYEPKESYDPEARQEVARLRAALSELKTKVRSSKPRGLTSGELAAWLRGKGFLNRGEMVRELLDPRGTLIRTLDARYVRRTTPRTGVNMEQLYAALPWIVVIVIVIFGLRYLFGGSGGGSTTPAATPARTPSGPPPMSLTLGVGMVNANSGAILANQRPGMRNWGSTTTAADGSTTSAWFSEPASAGTPSAPPAAPAAPATPAATPPAPPATPAAPAGGPVPPRRTP